MFRCSSWKLRVSAFSSFRLSQVTVSPDITYFFSFLTLEVSSAKFLFFFSNFNWNITGNNKLFNRFLFHLYRHRELSEESRNANDRFTEFLRKSLPAAPATEIFRQTEHAVERIIEVFYCSSCYWLYLMTTNFNWIIIFQQNNFSNVNMDDLSGLVQHFYQTLSDKMRHNSALNGEISCLFCKE